MTHVFDELVALTELTAPTEEAGPRTFTAHTHPAWANMVGPYGGATAAQALAAVVADPRAQGRPAALTVNFTAPVSDGALHVVVEPVRTNRSNQHWTIRAVQEAGTVLTGTALLAADRESFSDTEAPLPADAGSPDEHAVQVRKRSPLTWLNNYEFRYVRGVPPLDPNSVNPQETSESLLWLRSAEERAWDHLSLTAAADVFPPRSFLRTGRPAPAGTISYSVYFHAAAEAVAAQGEYLLGQAQASRFHNGLFDQVGHLWGSAGELLATTTQLVYFKST